MLCSVAVEYQHFRGPSFLHGDILNLQYMVMVVESNFILHINDPFMSMIYSNTDLKYVRFSRYNL